VPAPAPNTFCSFAPFTATHALTLAAAAAALALTLALGFFARRRGRRALRRFDATLALLALAAWVWLLAHWLAPERFSWQKSLPLHLCDLAGLVAPLALLFPRPWLRTLLCLWGVGLCTQAFITPTVTAGPGQAYFYIFWTTHLAIVACCAHDLAVRRFVPTWPGFARAVGLTTAWLLLVVALNERLGANYGYVGSVGSSATTILDALGPWPQRVFILAAIVAATFALVTAAVRTLARIAPPAASTEEGNPPLPPTLAP
jgi:hypothetical integral membrane protein (TIGR02206 family)